MKFKKTLFVILVFIICMFAIMLSSSYAWYSFTNGSTTFDVVTNNNDIEVIYHTGMYINTTSALPISETQIEEYSEKNKFSIDLNNKDLVNKLLVDISLIDVEIDEELQSSNFKYDLLYNGITISSGSFTGAVSNEEFEIANNVILETVNKNDFELRLYILDNDEGQNNLMNKTFKGTISVNVVSRLKTTIEQEGVDILINNIIIDGKKSDSLPTTGTYNMSASCQKGSELSWDPISKTITYNSGSKVGDSCSLTFTSVDDYDYQNLSEMPVGSYVKYTGTGGRVGNKKTTCQQNGTPSSSNPKEETESPNSCAGQNAREDIDNDNSYGYCNNSLYKYTTTGWRIAYIDTTKNEKQAVIISAGSPECMSFSKNITSYIQESNTKALKYCNKDLVDGNCTCVDNNSDGICDEKSADAWNINDTDFYNITKSISGTGRKLTSDSSNINTNTCYQTFSNKECGYNNDLLDNGGSYLFSNTSPEVIGTSNALLWQDRHITTTNNNKTSYGLRPLIKLSSNVKVISGTGTKDDPYIIEK